VRKRMCVPMMALCLLLTACGGTEETGAANLRDRYHDMTGCMMEAAVSCDHGGSSRGKRTCGATMCPAARAQ